MVEPRAEYFRSGAPEPHRQRTKDILKAHPEIRRLIGPNPVTFFFILGVVGMQMTLAWTMGSQAWWAVLLLAYGVGAFANHCLYVLIHECAHNLVFRRRWANLFSSILADLPNVVPSSISFRRYHLNHHSFQGVYELDADLPSYWESRLLGGNALSRAVWLLFFPVLQGFRPFRFREVPYSTRWTWIANAAVIASNLAVLTFWGPMALLYLFASFYFAISLHPLGARWIQEHYTFTATQETFSYYGPLNLLALNVGYHNEHHDFPSVPWNRLPQIRQLAPEFYDTLIYHTSWTRLLLTFLFDGRLNLYSRIHRDERAGAKVLVGVG